MLIAASYLKEYLGGVPCVLHEKGFWIYGKIVHGCQYHEVECQALYICRQKADSAPALKTCSHGSAVKSPGGVYGYSDSMRYHAGGFRHMETLSATRLGEATDSLPHLV